jgi:TPR repeat protein
MAGKPKPSPPAADEREEAIARKIIPGADELAKANNASDSAAEAAWLWKATAKGNPTAPVRLAGMYVKGEGVPRSCEQALVLLKTAAEKENAVARNQLASMYGSGVCVPRNRVEAYRWASSALAANPNSDWAQQRRDQLWQQMTPEERALAEKYR